MTPVETASSEASSREEKANAAPARVEAWLIIRDCWRTVRPHLVFWPLCVLPLPILAVLLADRMQWSWLLDKGAQEAVAVPLIAAAAAAWTIRAGRTRDRLAILLACQAWIFTWREMHLLGSHEGVYVLSTLVLAWALLWAWRYREWLRRPETDWIRLSLVVLTVCGYALALLIQRRWFRFAPGEAELHISLEECTENMAHLSFLVAACSGTRKKRKRTADPGPPVRLPRASDHEQSDPGR